MAVNKVILLGNVGKDPQISTMTSGAEVATFSLATTDVWKDKNTHEKREKTEWHKIVIYSAGLVNVVKNYVRKGTKVYLEGTLQTRKWTSSNGLERYATEVVLQGFSAFLQILDSKNVISSNPNSSISNDTQDDVSVPFDNDNVDEFVEEKIDDEIPF